MQNVVTVASQSPPDVMTSTKPAVQTATAPVQDPFELVLQKTSERLNEKRCESASPGNEQGSIETQKSQNSTTNKTVSETHERKGVPKTESDTEEKIATKDKETNEEGNDSALTIFPFESVVVVQQIGVPVAETLVEASVDVSCEAESNSLPAAMVLAESLNSESDMKAATINDSMRSLAELNPDVDGDVVLSDQSIKNPKDMKVTSDTTFNPTETNIDSSTFTEANNPSTPVDPQIDTDGKNAVKVEMKNGSAQDSQKSNEVQNQIDAATVDTKNIKLDSQTQATTATSTTSKEVIERTENQGQSTKETAPPDTPTVTESVATPSTVKTSQLDEPARLAEAPKSEVVAQIASQIDQMVKTNRSSVRMQLYPEELGHIDIQITTTKNGIGVTMIADSASTQDALKSEMNNLKQNMQQAGIQLSDLNIGQGQNSNKQQQFEDKQNFANTAYQSNNTSGTKTIDTHKQVQLQTTAIDYRI